MRPRVDHLEERAELYALGMLDADDVARIDAHVAECGACEQRIGAAEAAVAALVDATQPPEAAPAEVRSRIPRPAPAPANLGEYRAVRRRPLWLPAWAGSAVAAVFAAATVFLGVQNAGLRTHIADDGLIFGALVASHFSHAQFSSPAGAAVAAKVVYERRGGWYEIFATGIDPHTRVAAVRAGTAVELPERFSRSGTSLALSVRGLGRVDEFRLLDGAGRTLAAVRPAYAR
jgi:hypothetical protein